MEDPAPIDAEKRAIASRLLRDFTAGRITNDSFDEGWPLRSRDPALFAIFGFAWHTYDDLRTHHFDAGPETAAHLARCADFLDSGEPYVWPRPHPLLFLLSIPLALLTLGLSNRLLYPDPPPLTHWPFASLEDWERHRTRAR